MRVGERKTSDTAEMRKCIASAKFGIEAHEAPVTEFPAQPSQKDGLGRMCRPHWNEYLVAFPPGAWQSVPVLTATPFGVPGPVCKAVVAAIVGSPETGITVEVRIYDDSDQKVDHAFNFIAVGS